jgi:hypothetical protein
VLLAIRTAIDAAVKHATEEGKPLYTKVVTDVMNLLMSRDRVTDLHSLRTTCELTRRGSFPVPGYPLLELPTGMVDAFMAGSGSRHVSFECLLRALHLHSEDAAAAAATAVAAADTDDDA